MGAGIAGERGVRGGDGGRPERVTLRVSPEPELLSAGMIVMVPAPVVMTEGDGDGGADPKADRGDSPGLIAPGDEGCLEERAGESIGDGDGDAEGEWGRFKEAVDGDRVGALYGDPDGELKYDGEGDNDRVLPLA
jgi:hypothetical protein